MFPGLKPPNQIQTAGRYLGPPAAVCPGRALRPCLCAPALPHLKVSGHASILSVMTLARPLSQLGISSSPSARTPSPTLSTSAAPPAASATSACA
jgi:hypothetical protein